MNFEKNISALGLLTSSVLLFILGLAILIRTDVFLSLFPYVAGLILVYTSLSKFYSYYTDRNRHSIYILIGDTAMLIQGIVALIRPDFVIIIFPAFAVFYATLLSVISFIAFHQYRKAQAPYSSFMFLKGALYLAFAILVITAEHSTLFSTRLTGIYLLFYSVSIFTDFINEEIPQSYTNRINRKVSVKIPVLFTANVLSSTLDKVNDFFSSVDTERRREINLSESHLRDEGADMDILIHVNKNGVGIFGHTDIFFDGYVLSFGNYDMETIKLLGALGEGVLVFAKGKDRYIDFCVENYDKTIFDYGLKLTPLQKEKVKEKIEEHIKNSVQWIPPCDRHPDVDRESYTDYASRLRVATDASFRKMKKGRFKYYFTFYSNCVKYADSIVGQAGIDILNLNGIISPGAYFNYFDGEYRRKNSIVISKTVYSPKGIVK